MKIHELKSWPSAFQALRMGLKTADVRNNDRDYEAGDVLVVQEWDPDAEDYTIAAPLHFAVRHLQDLAEFGWSGLVLMSLERLRDG